HSRNDLPDRLGGQRKIDAADVGKPAHDVALDRRDVQCSGYVCEHCELVRGVAQYTARKHGKEVGLEPRPFHVAQTRHPRGNVYALNVPGHLVAEFHLELAGDPRVERYFAGIAWNERARALTRRSEPPAFGQRSARRDRVAIRRTIFPPHRPARATVPRRITDDRFG